MKNWALLRSNPSTTKPRILQIQKWGKVLALVLKMLFLLSDHHCLKNSILILLTTFKTCSVNFYRAWKLRFGLKTSCSEPVPGAVGLLRSYGAHQDRRDAADEAWNPEQPKPSKTIWVKTRTQSYINYFGSTLEFKPWYCYGLKMVSRLGAANHNA